MVEPQGAMSQVRDPAIRLRLGFEHTSRLRVTMERTCNHFVGRFHLRIDIALILLVGIAIPQGMTAQQTKEGVPQEDSRNTEIRTTDTPAPLPEFSSLKAWEERKAFLRNQILVSAGLSPMPE